VTDIINVCVCPSCSRLTTMKKIAGDKYFCRSCKKQFKQYRNGKLIYIPLPVADAIERAKDQLLFEFESDEVSGEIIFEPEFDED
jgi:ribosomal protein L37AE/L43A